MSFVASDLEDALESYGMDPETGDVDEEHDGEGGWEEVSEFAWGEEPFTVELEAEDGTKVPVEVKIVDYAHGTYDGDTYLIFEALGRNFRKNGWTASHYGTEWEGSFEEVESEEKVVKYWRKKR